MLQKIKIFVSHRPEIYSRLIRNGIFVNVNCGSTLFPDVHYKGVVGDNTGINISEKGKFLNELTVQYWAWKNFDLDYYGLCHYRRYLSFSNQMFPVLQWQCGDVGHVISERLCSSEIKKYCLKSKSKMVKIIKNYDIIYSDGIPIGYYDKAYGQNSIALCQHWLDQPQLIPNDVFMRLLKLIENKYPLIYSCA